MKQGETTPVPAAAGKSISGAETEKGTGWFNVVKDLLAPHFLFRILLLYRKN
jgi:hypothetical protein